VSTRIDSTYASALAIAPGLTTETDGALLVGGVGLDSASLAVNPPSGWTEAWESTGGQVAELAHTAMPTAGPTGDVTSSLGARGGSATWLVALKPAG